MGALTSSHLPVSSTFFDSSSYNPPLNTTFSLILQEQGSAAELFLVSLMFGRTPLPRAGAHLLPPSLATAALQISPHHPDPRAVWWSSRLLRLISHSGLASTITIDDIFCKSVTICRKYTGIDSYTSNGYPNHEI